MMRVLTVRQPWAWAIIHGGKDVENRVRNIAGAYRGPVAIHAGLSYDMDATICPPPLYAPIPVDEDGSHMRPLGAIIGVIDLVDVHDPSSRVFLPTADVGGTCSPWAEHGVVHLVLANPRALAEPIPYRGALGLRRLDDDTTTRILAQIGEPV
jgi:hypothetical protein